MTALLGTVILEYFEHILLASAPGFSKLEALASLAPTSAAIAECVLITMHVNSSAEPAISVAMYAYRSWLASYNIKYIVLLCEILLRNYVCMYVCMFDHIRS